MAQITQGASLVVDGLIWVVSSVSDDRVTAIYTAENGNTWTLNTLKSAVSAMGNGLFCLPGRIESRSTAGSVVAEPATIVVG